MKHCMKLGQGPKGRIDRVRIPDKIADAGGLGFIEVELRYIGRVEIQGYRSRSSSMIFVLSLTRGIRSQTLCMDARLRAFRAAGMGRGEVTGRNSATGSPRLSITITPPSAASRTNFDVLMCSSRTDVVLICYIVAPDLAGKAADGSASRRLEHMIVATSPELESWIPATPGLDGGSPRMRFCNCFSHPSSMFLGVARESDRAFSSTIRVAEARKSG